MDSPLNLNVSRETLDRLKGFEVLLRKWNSRINLVSRNSLRDFWVRHIADSVQVFRAVEARGHWVDIGSGAGFPGAVVAVLAAVESPTLRVTLIESDQRKAAFLRAAARETGAPFAVLSQRIEQAEPQQADILSARALASLPDLLGHAERHLKQAGTAVFPKGTTWKNELFEAQKQWNFRAEAITSETEPEAAILRIRGISRV